MGKPEVKVSILNCLSHSSKWVPDLTHSPKNELESTVGLSMFRNTKCRGIVELKAGTLMIRSPARLYLKLFQPNYVVFRFGCTKQSVVAIFRYELVTPVLEI